MPQLGWYLQRLRAMSLPEIPWRAWRMVRTRAGAWRRWPTASEMDIGAVWDGPCSAEAFLRSEARFPFTPSPAQMAAWPIEWRERCLADAEEALAHRFSFFMFEREPFGDAIDWHRDYASGKRVPLDYSGRLDYRNPKRVGDVKVIWELSRMQHLTRLAQAWRWSGDERFPREIVAQITDWIERNPWMHGIHWTSPMECALRLITWTWTFHWIRDWPGLTDAFCRLMVASVHQHLATISSTYSLFSSANNHLIAEASGAYVAAAYWADLKGANKWKEQARRHLVHECLRQNYPDGVNFEHTFPYQFFVWDLLLLPALAAKGSRDEFPQAYWKRLEKMAGFLAWVSDCNGNTPNVGDQDDGLSINLGGDLSTPIRSLLAVAGHVFSRDDFLAWSGAQPEEKASWLLDEKPVTSPVTTPRRQSRAFSDGGYHVLRSGRGANDEVLLLFDVAPIGDSVTGVHGHADALGVLLHLGGQVFLCDPGTYSYQNSPLRHFFRATAQHNTLGFDEEDQAEYLNRFMWGRRPKVNLVSSDMNPDRPVLTGKVNWWTGASHERRVDCNFISRRAQLFDTWCGTGDAFLNFTVAPEVQVTQSSDRKCELTGERASLRMEFDNGALSISPMEISPRCYQKRQTTRIRVRLPREGAITTMMEWHWRD